MNEINDKIVIYTTESGLVNVDVKIRDENIWLTQKQISELFGVKRPAITKHLKNIYLSGELDELSTCSKMEHMGNNDQQVYKTTLYNLDVILSLGYKINSKNATHFRIWANKVLKDYLIKGYAVNQQIKLEQYNDLKRTVSMLSNILDSHQLQHDEAVGLLKVVSDYTYALDTLDKYDFQTLEIENTSSNELFKATYDNAMSAINELRIKFGSGGLFGNEKDKSFKSSISTIYQTFDGKDLYPSVEEKAAILLYLVVKNHSFSDGNKRIAAFLFLWFMEKNNILYSAAGFKRIGNNTLVALTLMIAESKTEEMDIMVKVIVNLINKNN